MNARTCRRRDEFGTVFQPAGLNHAMQDLGLQVWDGTRELRRFQDAFEERPRGVTISNRGPGAGAMEVESQLDPIFDAASSRFIPNDNHADPDSLQRLGCV